MIRLTGMWSFGTNSVLVVGYLLLLIGSSKAKISPTCEKESKLVYSYTSLQEELHLLLHTNVGGQVHDCDYTTPTAFFCHIEYQAIGETNQKYLQEYNGLCQRANGKIIHRSITIGHNLLDEFLSFTFTMMGIPQCVGRSCDENTIEQSDLQNQIFADFVQEMEVGDICDPESKIKWGKLHLGSDFGVQLASWAGIDFRDCFDRPSSEEEEQADAGSSKSSKGPGGTSTDSAEEEEDDGGRRLLRGDGAGN